MGDQIDQEGSCHCRAVKFKAVGPVVFNGYCHCKACTHSRGMSPVHLLAIPAEGFDIFEGKDFVTMHKGYGSVTHFFCSKCGCIVYQCPEGASFRAIQPTNFHIEDGVNCKLPKKYLPKFHVNYENRQMDWCDDLPKFKCFPPNGKVDNSGQDIV